jgi:hypothetical protein
VLGPAVESITIPAPAKCTCTPTHHDFVFFVALPQLSQDLNVPKGPQLGKMTAAVMDWQMAHPQGSKEECLEALRQQMAQAAE